jgi:hypothetical protein
VNPVPVYTAVAVSDVVVDQQEANPRLIIAIKKNFFIIECY